MRIQGRVRRWSDPNRGFGWATGDDGADYFIHVKQLSPDYEFDDIPVGSVIEFEPTPSDRHLGKFDAREIRVLVESV